VRDDLLPTLACPFCAAHLERHDLGQVGCANGHRFDEARQGHLTLLPAKRRALIADTPEMVDARIRFLGAGHYAPISRALAGAVHVDVPGIILDVGSGPATYLSSVLDSEPKRLGVALDLSPAAIRRAARMHPRIGAVVGDVTERLPIVDGAAALVLDVFAPRNQREYARVLAPNGRLVVVTPRPGHLAELAAATIAVDPAKDERLHASLEPTFELERSEDITWRMQLSGDDVHDVVHMGPSHHHVDPDARFEAATVTGSVAVSVWRRAREDGA
jgi:23S rRNA (guanine745-N1)-methyltransferase